MSTSKPPRALWCHFSVVLENEKPCTQQGPSFLEFQNVVQFLLEIIRVFREYPRKACLDTALKVSVCNDVSSFFG